MKSASPGLTQKALFAILHYRKINSNLNRQRDFSGAGMAPNNVQKHLAPIVTHSDPQLLRRLTSFGFGGEMNSTMYDCVYKFCPDVNNVKTFLDISVNEPGTRDIVLSIPKGFSEALKKSSENGSVYEKDNTGHGENIKGLKIG